MKQIFIFISVYYNLINPEKYSFYYVVKSKKDAV